MEKVKFIYNPTAGDGRVVETLDEIIAAYQRYNLSIVPYRLTFKENPYDMICDIDDSYHHILIAGGDGTVNYVVNLLKRNNVDKPVAFIPAGTANDFSTLIGMSDDIMESCDRILNGKVHPIDLGKVNGKYFVNIFSCGLFTGISQATPTTLKNTFGKLAYIAGGVGDLARFRKMDLKIESDGGNYDGKCAIFFVFNGQTAGKFRIAYRSKIDDGKLDVIIVEETNLARTLLRLTHFLRKGSDRDYPDGVLHFRCKTLVATSAEKEPTDIDGQEGPSFPLDVECVAEGLKVIVPSDWRS